MKKVLVTGATGFVGTHLLEELAARKVPTVALYHSRSPERASTGIEWVACDLTREDVEQHLAGVEIVFHLAAYAGLGSDPQTLKQLHDLNVLATEKLAAAALKAGARFVFVSSVHACDGAPGGREVDENSGPPRSEYGFSKVHAEKAISDLGAEGLNFTTLRPTQLFGEYHEGSIYELARAIQRRRFLVIGTGRNATNFLYVKDFVDILLRVALSSRCNRETYIVADDPIPLTTLASQIGTQLGVALSSFRLPRMLGLLIGAACDLLGAIGLKLPLSMRRVRAMTDDIRYSRRKLNAVIGPHLPYGVSAGLARSINWYRATGLL